MKKLFSVMLCMMLLISAVSITAFAEDAVVAKIGSNTYTSLADAIDAANADADVTTIELLTDVTVDTTIAINEALVFNGNNNTVTTNNSKKTFEVYADFTINDTEIINNFAYGRCIDTRVGGIELNVNNCVLTCTSSANPQPITIGGNAGSKDNAITVNIADSEIIALGGYGITTFNPVEMVVSNSTVTGFAALYMKGADGSIGSAGSAVAIKGSVMHSVNTIVDATDTNSFGTIVFEDDGITIAVDGKSTVSCESSGDQSQVLIGLKRKYNTETGKYDGEPTTNNSIVVDNGAKLNTVSANDATAAIIGGTVISSTADGEVATSNTVAVPSDYAKQIYNNGNGYITTIEPETGLTVIVMKNSDYENLIGHNHNTENLKKVEGKAPTCTEDGILEHYTCNNAACSEVLYGDAQGSIILATAVTKATGHSIVKVEAVASTTEKEGNITHFKCENCGTLYADENGKKALSAKDVITAKLSKSATASNNDNIKSPNTGDDAIFISLLLFSALIASAFTFVFAKK